MVVVVVRVVVVVVVIVVIVGENGSREFCSPLVWRDLRPPHWPLRVF